MDRREVILGAAAAATAGFLLPSVAEAEPAGQRAPLGIRRSGERGHANHGWLDSRFSFSSQTANANMPRSRCKQAAPHSQYAANNTSVSDLLCKRCPARRRSSANSR